MTLDCLLNASRSLIDLFPLSSLRLWTLRVVLITVCIRVPLNCARTRVVKAGSRIALIRIISSVNTLANCAVIEIAVASSGWICPSYVTLAGATASHVSIARVLFHRIAPGEFLTDEKCPSAKQHPSQTLKVLMVNMLTSRCFR